MGWHLSRVGIVMLYISMLGRIECLYTETLTGVYFFFHSKQC